MDDIFHKSAPALNWEEGHILGNGDLGAVVWGYPGEICVGLSKHDVNFLTNPEWDRRNPHGETYHTLAEKISSGMPVDEWVKKLPAPLKNPENRSFGPFPISCGRLSLFPIKDEYPATMTRDLEWEKGECKITCGLHPRHQAVIGAPTAEIKITAKVLAGENILLIRLSSEIRQKIQFIYSAGYLDILNLKPAKFANASMHRELPENTSFDVCLEGGESCTTPYGIMGEISFGGEAGETMIKVAVATSFESQKPLEAAKRLLQMPIGELEEEHRKWWKNFWSKSNISISEKWIEDLWRFGVYAGGAGTRPDKSPYHLQGIWNQHRVPAWRCDMHFNANIQEAHWFAGPNNHPELEEALVRCMLFDWRESFRETAKIYGLPGLMAPFCADWKGRPIAMWNHLALAMGCTAWLCQHLDNFMRYNDTAKWRSEIRDFYKEAATLYLDILQIGEDGKLHIQLSESPEQVEHIGEGKMLHTLGKDPTIDIASIKMLFTNFIKLSAELGLSDEILEKVKQALPKLPELPTNNGHFIDYATAYFKHGEAIGEFKWSHRHPSRLLPIFPGNEIDLEHNLKLGIDSFKEFRSYGENGFTSWSLAWQACIAAKLGLADLAEDRLNQLKSYNLGGGLMEHGSSYEARELMPKIFQLEVSLGAAAAVAGMMLQEVGRHLYLFPAVERSREASFKDLRVSGGTLVSASKQGEKVTELSITSRAGGSFLLILPYGKGQIEVELKPGETKKML